MGEPDKTHEQGELIGGRYVLGRELGRGGMGVVFEGFDSRLERDVAIKLLDTQRLNRENARERFRREALAAGRVVHPNICDVRDRGVTSEGVPFIVMELLAGRSLADILAVRSLIAPARAISVALQILQALNAAHSKGVVHRDLKPANVFILSGFDGKEQVKLLDFGIATIREDAHNMGLTATGKILGTPMYMSPEQARGKGGVDHRTDLWAVGVILFEALSGRTPFRGDNYNDLMFCIADDPCPKLRVFAPHLPEKLELVVMRALEKDIDRRYKSARDFALALADTRQSLVATLSLASPADALGERPSHPAADLPTLTGEPQVNRDSLRPKLREPQLAPPDAPTLSDDPVALPKASPDSPTLDETPKSKADPAPSGDAQIDHDSKDPLQAEDGNGHDPEHGDQSVPEPQQGPESDQKPHQAQDTVREPQRARQPQQADQEPAMDVDEGMLVAPSSSKTWLVALGALLLVCAGVGIAVVSLWEGHPPAPPSSPSETRPRTDAAAVPPSGERHQGAAVANAEPEPALVEVPLRGLPPKAAVWFQGKKVSDAALRGHNGLKGTLKVTAKGYQPLDIEVVLAKGTLFDASNYMKRKRIHRVSHPGEKGAEETSTKAPNPRFIKGQNKTKVTLEYGDQ